MVLSSGVQGGYNTSLGRGGDLSGATSSEQWGRTQLRALLATMKESKPLSTRDEGSSLVQTYDKDLRTRSVVTRSNPR